MSATGRSSLARAGRAAVMFFVALSAAGAGLSAALTSGHPILAARWSLLWWLGGWAAVWIAGVAADHTTSGTARCHLRTRAPVALGASCLLAVSCSSTPRPVPAVPEPATAPAGASRLPGQLITVGGQPEGLTVDDRTGTLAIGVRGPDGVVLVRLPSFQIDRKVALRGAPRHLELAAPGGPLLVPAESTDRLYELSLPDGRLVAQAAVGRQPHDAAAASAGRVFVGNELADTVSVVSGGRVVQVLPGPTQPGGVSSSADGTVVVVVGVRGRRLTAYHADGTIIGTAPAGVGPTHIQAGSGNLFYVADTQGNAILTFAVEDNTVRQVGRIAARGAPYGLAVDPARGVLYVTLTATNQLEAFRIEGSLLVAGRRWSTPRQPNSVAADPATGRVYVAGAADGLLQVLQP